MVLSAVPNATRRLTASPTYSAALAQTLLRRGVEPDELVVAVLLDAGGTADLAAGGRRDRAGGHQHQIADAQPVRGRDRGGDLTSDVVEPAVCGAVEVGRPLELDDGHQFLGAAHRNRYRRHPAAGDRLHRRLDVLRVVVAA